MRRPGIFILTAAVIAVAAGFAHWQSPSATQKAVFALEEEWTRALVRRDTMAFKRLTVPGFVYTEDNVVMNQSELIQAVVKGDKVAWAGNEGMKLHDYTPVAVVTGILVVKGRGKDNKAYTNRYRFTDTWLYRGGKWQAIAAQDYLIPR
jgi:ketosteroid isomerase-like protein